jgi:putative ATP-dependent endonuclease of the OLD family
VDLFKAGLGSEFHEAIAGLTENKKMRQRFKSWADDPDSLHETQFLKDINSLGKGRVAQRLASTLLAKGEDHCPPYIQAALDFMKEKLA